MENLYIVDYDDEYKDEFQKLSLEWLIKYASVEPEDERILENPRKAILDDGGHIFFAKYNNEIVGTVALIKIDENTYELAKLAVTERYKGLGIGNELMNKCMEQAEKDLITKMILYTADFLIPAVALYKKYGFTPVPSKDNKYIESNLIMEKYFL